MRDDKGDQSGRVDRYRLVYDDAYDDLWKYCLRRAATVHEAEDVLGQVFAVAWRRLDEIPDGASRPWLFGVARNQLRSSRRGRRRTGEILERLRSGRPATVAQFHAPSDSSEIRQALATLSEADQEVLRLVAWENLNHADAAVALGCSENAVAIRVHRARERFRRELANLKGLDLSTHVPGEGGSGQ